MEKNSIISLIAVCLWLLAGCATFPTKSEPGLYVNDWPAFFLSYPANWVEKTPEPQQAFRAERPEGVPGVRISVFPSMGMPLEYSTRVYIPELSKIGKDINVIYEKGTKLKDGTVAHEAEIDWVVNPGIKLNTLLFTAKKDDLWILVSISDTKGRIGEDLKHIAYSLKIKPGKDELVKVSTDVQEFLDQYSKDMVSHDIAKVMVHFSDQFLDNGNSKSDVEGFLKMVISGVTSYQPNITKFESQENNAYLGGFVAINGSMKFPFKGSLSKENGKWIFYGNQKQKQM
jgi:hypothetical protein